MAPHTRAKPSTNTACQLPWAMSRQPKASTAAAAATMNMIPPMVGVPSLFLCQLGPISLMDCPACSARRMGMSTHPTSTEITKAVSAASSIRTIAFSSALSFVFSPLSEAFSRSAARPPLPAEPPGPAPRPGLPDGRTAAGSPRRSPAPGPALSRPGPRIPASPPAGGHF